MLKLIRNMGVNIDRHEDGVVQVDAGPLSTPEAPYELVKTMRASVLALGPLLARFIDLAAIGEYRAELVKLYGPDLPSLRVILTTTEAANSGLQAHISIGTRQP